MSIPFRGPDGQRQTVNYGISQAQTLWNFRSAMNVAALNCLAPKYAPILDAYTGLLDNNKKVLSSANKTVESEFRERYGKAEFRSELDNYMTRVYNYYALPPVTKNFCDTALSISPAVAMLEGATLPAFAMGALPQFEEVFEDFYTQYEQYRVNVAAWDAEYNPRPALVTTFPDMAPPESSGVMSNGAISTGVMSNGVMVASDGNVGTSDQNPMIDPAFGTSTTNGNGLTVFQPAPSVVTNPVEETPVPMGPVVQPIPGVNDNDASATATETDDKGDEIPDMTASVGPVIDSK
ncbi:hypothetical protein HME9302_00547 [Alteripontixanthobacter maritimus]|uniref:Uncharacterized protein n=1 Tax=Alteripontixanthobacter maritimus TaxID=2161824 RepID=A0A369Q4J6_9SPHN|nr:hypothetical protein [Alteripontixanthobacter maritimus]RDC59360.1 hypothetical protein HME9302_00547 [Alteripontixanthobacter maritimus]